MPIPILHLSLIGQNPKTSILLQFTHYVFSFPNSKIKFLRGILNHTLTPPPKSNVDRDVDSPFSVSSEEDVQLESSDKKETRHWKEPLDTDLNALFPTKEDLMNETHV